MKKNLILSSVTGALISSTLLLTACQGIEQLFTDSPARSAQPSYGTSNQHTTTVYQSGASNSSASRATSGSSTANSANTSSSGSSSASTATEPTTQAAKKTAGTAVPLEAPTVGQ
ncbi:hypothetical protein [Legionella hackeliae]|uniref:Lipoprotein n=1 Tax=Legionella hackeliae TaxID=449 RepID=A0A0A8UTF7_LEGHA|nr:hypothetical protein [Legionella hackeliae]KTD12683.1 hypothetical protein Lhac_1554 [Legionella hackeliae]CEK12100.1 exported protein of unknown function [Legionella hackeliae]STX48888.1 Uncharacterised protein [Legionella hackeliae]